MTTLKLALLGTGRIADVRLAPAMIHAEGLRLWSVLSRDQERARQFAARHGASSPNPAYTQLDDLLDDPELDGVVIATPDGVHAEQAMASVRAGKHVFVEKPMVTEFDDGAALVAAADSVGVTLGVAYHLRWHEGHRVVARLLNDGAFGELRHIRAQWTWPAQDASNWRARRSVGRWWSLGGVGTHCLDTIRWLAVPTCGEVVEIQGLTNRSVWNGPHDETALVAMEFESGATAEFCCSVQFASVSRLEVYGSAGCAIAEDTLTIDGAGHIRTNEGAVEFEVKDPYQGELVDFARAVLERRPPAVDGREGLRNVELLTRIA